ncbi:hypothetical protein JCM10212_003864 [Sporobolomyces blumeae]
MARDSNSQKHFGITSFLPRAFAPPQPQEPANPNGVSGTSKGRGRSSASSRGDGREVKPRLDAVKDELPDVIDLTEDDDDLDQAMLPPPVPLKRNSKVASREPTSSGKGKHRALEDEPERDEQGMWVDRFGPMSREELSVHARKVSDVSTWLEEAFGSNAKLSKYRRILVLSGPAGAGKTATIQALAREMEVEIVEWKEEGNVQNAGDEFRESVVHRFTSFLARAGMAPSLDFGSSDDSDTIASTSSLALPSASSSTGTNSTRRLILLEDLPNVSHYPTKLALRSALTQYLTSPRVTCPLVIVISEALSRPGADHDGAALGSGWAPRDDSTDARSVCGVQVLQHPACREISFNPIAPTIMKKALNRILDRISASSSWKRDDPVRPSASTLDVVIQHSNGDIRSALMALEFLANEGRASSAAGDDGRKMTSFEDRTVSNGKAKGKGRKRKIDEQDDGEGQDGEATRSKDAKGLIQFVTARENSLFVFHALGKVLYNKRWGDSAADDKKDLTRPGILQARDLEYKLPRHLRREWERRPSKVDPDVLFAEAPIDSDIFLTYLHHNYPQFTSDSISSCSTILDGLSASDALLRLESDDSPYRRAPLTSLYSFAVAVRTTLLGLPSPVERNKQKLRKSELWDNLKLARSNEEGVAEVVLGGMAREGGNVGVSFSGREQGLSGREEREEAEDGIGLVTMRDKRCLMSEIIPWLGVIRPRDSNPFLLDLADFPPVDLASDWTITGDALGEKDTSAGDDDDDGDGESRQGGGVEKLSRGRAVLEEVEEHEVDLALRSRRVDEQEWFEREDDIVDPGED